MSDFAEQCEFSLAPALLEYFGEDVTYTAQGYAAVAIKGMVSRGGIIEHGPAAGTRIRDLTVVVAQADLPAVPNPGGDTVECRKRLGDAADSTFKVAQVVEQKAGLYRLLLVPG